VTSTSREGVSVLKALKESSWSLTENGVEGSCGIDWVSCVESAVVCNERAKGCTGCEDPRRMRILNCLQRDALSS